MVANTLSLLSGVASSSAFFTEYQLDCLDLYLVELGPIVNRCKRTLIPIVQERDARWSTLTKLYDQIGLDPTKPPIPTLARVHGGYDESMV